MLTSDFDYSLPDDLIASEPLPDRAASRMMVVHRDTGTIEHRQFSDLPSYSREGDLFILNDTRVVPARFFSEDGSREILRLEALSPTRWRCMVKPGKRFREGHTLTIGSATGTVVAIAENGDRTLQFDQPVDVATHGHLPLPPYMNREDRESDKERYQTVFAREEGSIAAPTAGLHFTPEILAQIPRTFVTLHVGVGTFQPVKADRVEDHLMHSEHYTLTPQTAAQINAAQRVIAVGTTACRVLESVHRKHGSIQPDAGETDIFIYPPYTPGAVGALLTNFHLPKSSLIMLVSALAGRDLIMRAYAEAIAQRYRFYSYGDCMLIL
jgi:S-adenosylmethionine:tRNA ribosyltransferase-isomerase